MPIDIDRFEDGTALDERPVSERIIRFLACNHDQAYTRREIADAVDAAPETVGTNLTRLKRRGLVRHRAPYWAFTDDWAAALATVRATYDDALLAAIQASHPGRGDEAAAGGATDSEPPSGPAAATREAPDDASQETGERPDTAPSPQREAARAFSQRVRDQLGEAVDDLYLFGSVARGTTVADSDVDVLVVVAAEADYAAVDDHLLALAYDVQLEYGVRIEVHTIAAEEFATRKARGDPFIRTAIEEGTSSV